MFSPRQCNLQKTKTCYSYLCICLAIELVLGSNKTMNWVCLHLLLALVFSANAVLCGTLVKSIPGFDGDLPFKLYPGCVRVCVSLVQKIQFLGSKKFNQLIIPFFFFMIFYFSY